MKENFFTKKTYALNEFLLANTNKLTRKNVLDNSCLNLYNNPYLCFNKSELIVLASRPSIGKTTLAINWGLDFAANQNTPVGIVTSGIPDAESLTLRLLALESKISPSKLRRNLLNENETEQIENATLKLSNLPIFISDLPNAKFEDIETAATEMVSKNNVKIIFVDGVEYLYEIVVSKSLCEDAQCAEQMKLYYDEIYSMLENFKNLACTLQIPVVLLVPIKRDIHGCEPNIYSFEDKLIIPKIADKVIMLHRERYKHSDKWAPAKLIMLNDLDNLELGNNVELEFNNMTCEFRYKDGEE